MSTVSLPDLGTMQMQNAKQGELQQEFAMRRLQEQLKNAPNKEAKLKEACKGFESIFLNKLWKQMRDSVPKEGFLHSKEEEMYLGMFDQKLSEQLADSGGIGLGDMLFKNLRANMLDASRTTSPSNAKDRLPIKPLNRHFNPRDVDPPSDSVKTVFFGKNRSQRTAVRTPGRIRKRWRGGSRRAGRTKGKRRAESGRQVSG